MGAEAWVAEVKGEPVVRAQEDAAYAVHRPYRLIPLLDLRGFSTTRAGYRAMLAWMCSHGNLIRVGVKATGSYGAGLTRHLALAGVPVWEVTGPDTTQRRGRGKDDTLDAIAAARAALTGQRVRRRQGPLRRGGGAAGTAHHP